MSRKYLLSKLKTLEDQGFNIDKRKRPKNIILFIGDGMGVTLTTVARIFKNQRDKIYDQTPLAFERFDVTGLVNTHTLNNHIGSSESGASAMFAGQKTLSLTMSVKASANLSNCNVPEDQKMKNRISDNALDKDMNVGLVTTTRLTHATPAALYAHATSRYSEFDVHLKDKKCIDIGKQLLQYPANEFKVMLGGGRRGLLPEDVHDPINGTTKGVRRDNLNIIKEWSEIDDNRHVLLTRTDLLNFNISELNKNSKVLGAFAESHFKYVTDLTPEQALLQPTLAEMTQTAIQILEQTNPNGYFLMVEGGLIDIASHYNKGTVAILETLEMEKAIEAALKEIDLSETLIIVTADHSHSLTFNGYNERTNPVLAAYNIDYPTEISWDRKNYPSIQFAAGAGFDTMWEKNRFFNKYYTRKNMTTKQFQDPNFVTPACIKNIYGLHGGESVELHAIGPLSHIFSGNYDNTQIAYNMKYLLCLEEEGQLSICDREPNSIMEKIKKAFYDQEESRHEKCDEPALTMHFRIAMIIIIVQAVILFGLLLKKLQLFQTQMHTEKLHCPANLS
uniref:Alkaline phosphatase n=1 Tax=Rhabditophanes sp. KR3021 TaxID=114890 RepID=A0AC35TNB8_9BILA